MLFLHGLGGNLTAWDPQRKYFENLGYTTIAIDLRGHGLSERPNDRAKYTPEIIAKDVLCIINDYKINNFVLVGHCIGGMVALVLTASHNVKPKALVLIATTYQLPSLATFVERLKILDFSSDVLNQLPFLLGKPGHSPMKQFKGTHDLSPRRILSDIFNTTVQSYISLCSNFFNFNGRKLLSKINCPTLIIHGGKDIVFPAKIAPKLHKYIKNSKLVLLPNANHILVLNNPDELNCIINQYLKQIKV
jgi:pimeloyl-ACP methyl ester carboxylesterase